MKYTRDEYIIMSLEAEVEKLKETIRLHESIAEHGEIYIKTSSQDCDGVCGYYNYTFTSVKEHDKTYDSWCESLEGRASWEMVAKRDLHEEEDEGTFGQGWGIN